MTASAWRVASVAVWGTLALGLATALVVARAGVAGLKWPGSFVAPAVRNRAVRGVLLIGWAWLGWHLFAR